MRGLAAFVLGVCLIPAAGNALDPEDPTKDTFDKGVALYDSGHYEDAYKIFESIDDDNVSAAHNVAYMKRRGQGTARDAEGAEELYKRAAMAGNPKSQADLGEMLLNGEAGPPDAKAAAGWLALAAAAHHPIAEFELGELYEQGRGVTRDITVARGLYQDAAARGVPGAKERLGALPPAETPPLRNGETKPGP